jgi:hypothetical protein
MIEDMESTGQFDLVQVFVPRRHLAQVYAFIASLEGVGAEPSAAAHTEDGWDEALIRRMYEESPTTVKRMLRALAEAPDEELTTDDLAAAMKPGANWNSVAGAFGAFGRRVKNRYRRSTWPFEMRWDNDLSRAFYKMSPAVGDIIKSYPESA